MDKKFTIKRIGSRVVPIEQKNCDDIGMAYYIYEDMIRKTAKGQRVVIEVTIAKYENRGNE